MKKITPSLWFDKDLKKIIEYYKSIFPEAKFGPIQTLSETPSGTVETGSMEIFGQEFNLMTAGPIFKFNESVSFSLSCKDQKEVDYYWNALTANGGEESQCGWLKDKYGLSWQIVPEALEKIMSKGTQEQRQAVMQAFLKMKKFDIKKLEEAFKG